MVSHNPKLVFYLDYIQLDKALLYSLDKALIFCYLYLSGKKCTYGIKCKYHHPERAKQSNRSVADELRLNAKQPPTGQKQPSARSSPAPGQSLSQVEDMAKKLTLGHESTSLKKDPKSEPVVQVKSTHRSSKRAAGRKERKSSSDHGSVRHGGSQEQLDSGLGSIDSQPVEAPWSVCDQNYRAPYSGCQQNLVVRQQYSAPRSAPSSCCPHGPPAHQHHSQRHSSSDVTPCRYPSCGTHAVSDPTYGQHSRVHGRQRQPYRHPPAVQSSQRDPPQGAPSSPSSEEREVVRKKLLAIFSAQLVDTAMDMFPQMMDPQLLVAEILMLQSQNRSLR